MLAARRGASGSRVPDDRRGRERWRDDDEAIRCKQRMVRPRGHTISVRSEAARALESFEMLTPQFRRRRAELGKQAYPGSRQRKCWQRDAALPDHECPMIGAEGSDGGTMMRRYVASSAWLGRVVILFLSDLKQHGRLNLSRC